MATFLAPHASLFDSRISGDAMDDDSEGEDLFVGTSTGASYRNLGGARPLTITSLLENAVQFVPQENKAPLDQIPYEPINITRVLPPAPDSPSHPSPLKSALKAPASSLSHLPPPPPSPFFPPIDSSVRWAKNYPVGNGLENVGNTCFLNSALQVLLHTAPLVRYLEEVNHPLESCEMRRKKTFCMLCALRICVKKSFHENRSAYTPSSVTQNLKKIAHHLRLGRQEDAHEFLRFCIDALQQSALWGKSPKLDPRIKETSFVHQIFGGKLRSRVKCLSCGHPSDTFDSILDLSLDVFRCDSIKDALATFVRVDQLKGANKYKCEKCKKLVVAEKSFTIDEAPMVLTIHLKRFTPSGKKISDAIKYPETLSLGPYMSDRDARPHAPPNYALYGVVNHSGGGPHSGHYTAYVKSGQGKWNNMNDSFVSQIPDNKPPINARNAYILFYCRVPGDSLATAINGHGAAGPSKANGVAMTNGNGPTSNGNGNGKRPRESGGGGGGEGGLKAPGTNWSPAANGNANGNHDGPSASKKPFIGPQIPSPLARPPTVATASTSSSSTPFGPQRPPQVVTASGVPSPHMFMQQPSKKKAHPTVKISVVGKLQRKQQRPAILT